MTAASPIVLEPAAQQVADVFAKPPFLYDRTPADARKVLDDAPSGPVSKLPVDEEWITVPAQVGDVRVRIIRPRGATGSLPVIVSMDGGGWILGNAGTHDRLVRELAGSPLPDRDRAGLRHRPVDHPRRASKGLDASPWRWPVNRWAAT